MKKSYLARNLFGLTWVILYGLTPNVHELSQAERLNNAVQIGIANASDYIPGDCDSLELAFRRHGMTDEESDFFFGRRILERESGCGQDTYNERTGDTGVCQLTHLHSESGYFFGKYYESGWAVELFGLYVGKRYAGYQRDDPNIIPACLWLLRGGSFEPGTINRSPWRASW